MHVQERYKAIPLGVNASVLTSSQNIGGFLAKTAGTITVTTITGTVIVDAIPVTAGVYTPIPFFISVEGFTVTLAGGASGTLGV